MTSADTEIGARTHVVDPGAQPNTNDSAVLGPPEWPAWGLGQHTQAFPRVFLFSESRPRTGAAQGGSQSAYDKLTSEANHLPP